MHFCSYFFFFILNGHLIRFGFILSLCVPSLHKIEENKTMQQKSQKREGKENNLLQIYSRMLNQTVLHMPRTLAQTHKHTVRLSLNIDIMKQLKVFCLSNQIRKVRWEKIYNFFFKRITMNRDNNIRRKLCGSQSYKWNEPVERSNRIT